MLCQVKYFVFDEHQCLRQLIQFQAVKKHASERALCTKHIGRELSTAREKVGGIAVTVEYQKRHIAYYVVQYSPSSRAPPSRLQAYHVQPAPKGDENTT